MITLESLEARHADEPHAELQASLRCRARRLARSLGVETPGWAACRNLSAAAQRARVAACSARGSIAVPREVPQELRAWRERTEGAIVHVSRAGVSLHTLGEVRRFATIAEAIAAVAA